MQKGYELITSRQNPLVQLTVSLSDRKHREREGLFRFDGRKLFSEALASGLSLFAVLLRESSAEALLASVGDPTLPCECRKVLISDSLFDRISEEKSPDGVITLAKRLDHLHRYIKAGQDELLAAELSQGHTLLLESVRDPGNLGTIVRSAAAFGLPNLILSADCADLYHPRTLRAAMGTLFCKRILVVEDFVGAIKLLSQRGCTYAAALDSTATGLGKTSFSPYDAVIVGNEGHGLSREALEAATHKIYIPMEQGVESLNAGIAASVLLWELYQGGR